MRISIYFIFVLLFFVACEALDGNVGPEPFSPKGTISGAIVDIATQKPLERVIVALNYPQEGERDTSITDSKGRFVFKDVPVVMEGTAIAEDTDVVLTNFPYGLYVDLSNQPEYRDNYYIQLFNLAFESTESGGAAVDLISNLVLPLGKQNSTVNGTILDPVTNEPVDSAIVEMFLSDDFTDFAFYTEVKLAEVATSSNGSFSFNGVEQATDVYFKVTKLDDVTNQISFTTDDYSIPASIEPNTVDLGIFRPFGADNSIDFYVTSVSPNDDSDLTFGQVSFSVTFNKPFALTEYTRTDLGFGNGTIIDDIYLFETGSKAKRADGSFELDITYSTDMKSIIITPTEELEDGKYYTFTMVDALDNLVDGYNNSLRFGSNFPFSDSFTAGIIPFSTGDNNALPNIPTLNANSDDLSIINYNGGNVRFSIPLNESNTPLAYYEVFESDNGAPFTFAGNLDIESRNNFGEILFSYGVGALYETGYLNQPISGKNVQIKVRAVSKNLQRSGYSNTITIEDKEDPDVSGVSIVRDGADTLGIQITFSEPMDYQLTNQVSNFTIERDSQGNGNFSEVNGAILSIENDSFRNSETPGATVITILFATDYDYQVGDVIVVDREVADLNGNVIDENRRTF